MKSLISYFIKYPVSGNVLLFVIALFGLIGFFNMRSTFFPENDASFISVQTVYPGASPEEVEEGIVIKIEDNLKGLTGVDRVTGISSENSGQVLVEVLPDYNIDLVLQDVKNAVDQINSFPVDMEPPVIFKREAVTNAFIFAISGDVDLKALKRFSREIENDLRAVDGISKIELSGFPDEEIEVSMRENDLRAYGLTFQQVAQAVSRANLEITGGTIKEEQEELLIRSRSKEYYAKDLEELVVATAADGRVVRLYEVADLRDRWADTPNRSYLNGKPAVVVNVNNTNSEDILFITNYIKEYIKDFNERNETITCTVINDASVALQQRIDLLSKNGIIGFVLVVLLLAMFLHIRLAFWVALSIPISFLGMAMVAAQIGLTINVISLFGMIIVIGILVDDGIVISENIYRHYEMGKDRFQAAYDGTIEVLPAVLSAVITTIIAFSSFLFFEGVTGDFFSDISVVVILTLTFSLIEGAFILPGHIGHSRALSKEAKPNLLERTFAKFMEWMKMRLYAPALRFFMNAPFLGIAIPIAMLILSFSLVSGGFVKTTFFPFVEGDAITVTLKMPAGMREEITQGWLDHIEKAAWEVNEELKAQRPDGKDVILEVNKNLGPTTYEGGMFLLLLDGETRQYSILKISQAIREKAGEIYGSESLTYSVATPFGKPVSIAIIGNDIEAQIAAVDEIKAELSNLSDLKDIVDNNQEGLREIDVTLKGKAQLLGLSLQEVIGQVRQGFFGLEVQRLQRGEDEVKVWVRYDEKDRSSIGDLENMRIRLSDGREFPLNEIANLEQKRGVIAYNRLYGKREIRVEADLATSGASATDVISTIETEIIPPILAKYPSVSYSMEGQVRETAKTQVSSQTVMPIILVLMLVTIILTFRSFGQTLVVFALIPFGLIGVILGHFLFAKAISILSGLGIIALVGIFVNDALVFVGAFNSLLQEGKSLREAIYEAGLSRFRPILLTSVTTVAGLAPLILEKSFQAQFLVPMAISVAFGLIMGTMVILLGLPVLLILQSKFRVATVQLWEGVKYTPEELEPAVEGRRSYSLLWFLVPVSGLLLLMLLRMIAG